jgi:type 1 glutamine amidotransferase
MKFPRKKYFHVLAYILVLVAGIIFISAVSKPRKKVLVFTKTAGYHHQSIPDGIEAIRQIGRKNGFDVISTTDSTWFRKEVLAKYSAVVFLNTTGNVLGKSQETAFENYIRNGGGFVGIHSATDTEYDWAWYGKLVGGYFESHPEQQQATLRVIDRKHPATKHLPETWVRFDEWYNFKNLNPDVHVGITIDESTYKGGKNGPSHPVAWWHKYDGGMAFYTAMGHTPESYKDQKFLDLLKGGINYVMRK